MHPFKVERRSSDPKAGDIILASDDVGKTLVMKMGKEVMEIPMEDLRELREEAKERYDLDKHTPGTWIANFHVIDGTVTTVNWVADPWEPDPDRECDHCGATIESHPTAEELWCPSCEAWVGFKDESAEATADRIESFLSVDVPLMKHRQDIERRHSR